MLILLICWYIHVGWCDACQLSRCISLLSHVTDDQLKTVYRLAYCEMQCIVIVVWPTAATPSERRLNRADGLTNERVNRIERVNESWRFSIDRLIALSFLSKSDWVLIKDGDCCSAVKRRVEVVLVFPAAMHSSRWDTDIMLCWTVRALHCVLLRNK